MTAEKVFEKFVPLNSVSYCVKLYEKLGFEIVTGCEEMGMMFLSLGGPLQAVAPSYF